MVIKRETNAPVWGTANPGEKVIISASWGQSAETTAGEDGKWKVTLKTPKAGGPYEITFKGNNELKITNVLAGDVWHASGQSNMQMVLEKCTDIDKEDLNFPQVRRLRVLHNAAKEPIDRIAGLESWAPVSRDTVKTTSATAYFFARSLYQKTGIPQGVIETPWNGKALEPFYANKELKELYPEEYKAMENHPGFSKEVGSLKRKIPNTKDIMPRLFPMQLPEPSGIRESPMQATDSFIKTNSSI
jgi:sialate O-acetylesterase